MSSSPRRLSRDIRHSSLYMGYPLSALLEVPLKTPYYWVYVIQSLTPLPGKTFGFTYVGCTNDPVRRLRQHNGEISGGGKYTSKHRPWEPRALYGPYLGRSEGLKAEYALKHGKRGLGRLKWSTLDSKWCRGLGVSHPWVSDPCNPLYFQGEYEGLRDNEEPMDKKFTIEAADVRVVSSVDDYTQKVGKSKGERPAVHKSARELFTGAPAPVSLSEAVRDKKDE